MCSVRGAHGSGLQCYGKLFRDGAGSAGCSARQPSRLLLLTVVVVEVNSQPVTTSRYELPRSCRVDMIS